MGEREKTWIMGGAGGWWMVGGEVDGICREMLGEGREAVGVGREARWRKMIEGHF
jgi:hypothetical protein